MGIVLNDNLSIQAGKPADAKYLNSSNATYTNVAAAKSAIPVSYRFIGLTVNVGTDEYWWKTGLTDGDLILKVSSTSFSNPMTTAGDLIVGGSAGTPQRLGIGTALQQVRVNAGGTALEYFTPSTTGLVFKEQNFTANGSTSTFVVSNGTLDQLSFVEINGNVQENGVNYTQSGQNIAFGTNIPNGDIVTVHYAEGSSGGGTVPFATATVSGIAKLYTSVGAGTDGSMDQNSITTALAGKQASGSYAVTTNNLSDLSNITTARSNLGLGTLSTQNGTFSGTSSGTNTGDQTITLTGDVTGSGTGSFAATVVTATSSTAGKARLYTATGSNTNGSMDQNSITSALSGKQATMVSGNGNTFSTNTYNAGGLLTSDITYTGANTYTMVFGTSASPMDVNYFIGNTFLIEGIPSGVIFKTDSSTPGALLNPLLQATYGGSTGSVGGGWVSSYSHRDTSGNFITLGDTEFYFTDASPSTFSAAISVKLASNGTVFSLNEVLNIDGALSNRAKFFGPLKLASYATGSLPAAASHAGSIVYDTTTTTVKFSNGSVWTSM